MAKRFDTLGFDSSFAVTVVDGIDHALLPPGEWEEPVWRLRSGSLEQIDAPEGPCVFRILCDNGRAWICDFGDDARVCGTSDPDTLLAVVPGRGVAFVDANSPDDGAVWLDALAGDVVRADSGLLLVNALDLTILRPDAGVVWRNESIVLDTCVVHRADDESIHLSGDLIGPPSQYYEVSTRDGSSTQWLPTEKEAAAQWPPTNDEAAAQWILIDTRTANRASSGEWVVAPLGGDNPFSLGAAPSAAPFGGANTPGFAQFIGDLLKAAIDAFRN